MPSIDADDSERIAMGIQARDPLGIKAHHDGVITAEHVGFHTAEMLTGSIPTPGDAPRVDLEPITRALLEHHGIDPDAVAAIASAAGGVGILDDEGDRLALVNNPTGHRGTPDDCRVWLEDGFTSYGKGLLRIPPLPETVLTTIRHETLSRIVSHPTLDMHDLVVIDVEEDGRALRIGFRSAVLGVDNAIRSTAGA